MGDIKYKFDEFGNAVQVGGDGASGGSAEEHIAALKEQLSKPPAAGSYGAANREIIDKKYRDTKKINRIIELGDNSEKKEPDDTSTAEALSKATETFKPPKKKEHDYQGMLGLLACVCVFIFIFLYFGSLFSLYMGIVSAVFLFWTVKSEFFED